MPKLIFKFSNLNFKLFKLASIWISKKWFEKWKLIKKKPCNFNIILYSIQATSRNTVRWHVGFKYQRSGNEGKAVRCLKMFTNLSTKSISTTRCHQNRQTRRTVWPCSSEFSEAAVTRMQTKSKPEVQLDKSIIPLLVQTSAGVPQSPFVPMGVSKTRLHPARLFSCRLYRTGRISCRWRRRFSRECISKQKIGKVRKV